MTTYLDEPDSLEQLQSPEQLALLDTIDELRSQGLAHHGINLPQLIVCGDQSSGKSSLLQGLTRLPFPTDSGICTIFATEVVMRRDAKVEISVEILPSQHRSPLEARELAKFKRTYASHEELSFRSLHDEAKSLMSCGKVMKSGDLLEDVLRVRYTGPDMPSFTIVDLPGLNHYQEGGDGPERIAKLMMTYMSNEKSIILAIVAAKNDIEAQEIFKYLDNYDPVRSRTLGIITKPDTTDEGSNSEKLYISLAKNEKMPMTHHWHTVRNRAWREKDTTDAERDETEAKFFTQGPWASIPR